LDASPTVEVVRLAKNARQILGIQRSSIFRNQEVIMVNRRRGDEQAQPDELGNDPGQVGPDSGGQSGDSQELSSVAEATDLSVQELADSDQAIEAGIVDGVEDAADHPERPVHTHLEYGRPDDLPPIDGSDELDDQADGAKIKSGRDEIDVEDLPDSKDRPDKNAA
jgi:hypothetical protein